MKADFYEGLQGGLISGQSNKRTRELVIEKIRIAYIFDKRFEGLN
jgi:hypothetical protein